MPDLNLSKNYEIIRSERGLAIKAKLEDLNQDESFWRTSSSDHIAEKVIDILNSHKDQRLEPRDCKNHKHSKAEAFLIRELLSSILMNYHSQNVFKASKKIYFQKPSCFVVHNLTEKELSSHLEAIDSACCTESMDR